MGDLTMANNQNAMFTLINGTGNAVFLAGEQAFPYRIGSSGTVLVNALRSGKVYGSPASSAALKTILRYMRTTFSVQTMERQTLELSTTVDLSLHAVIQFLLSQFLQPAISDSLKAGDLKHSVTRRAPTREA